MTYQLLPPLSQTEYESLKASINEHGVLKPIEVDSNGEIIDGHHRIKACQELGIDGWATIVKQFDSEEEKQAYVYMVNLARRQLSPEQVKAIRKDQKKLALKLKQQGRTQEQIAGLLGVSQATVSNWLCKPDESIINANNTFIDQRLSVPVIEHPKILARLDGGDTQEKVAADYHITRQRVGQIASKETKKRERKKQRTALAHLPSNFHLIHGDMFKVELPADVDLILADFPYNISGEGKFSKQNGEPVSFDAGEWDKIFDTKGALALLKDTLRPGGSLVFFTDKIKISYFWDYCFEIGLQPKNVIVWHKTNPPPQARANFLSSIEFLLWAVKPGAAYIWNGEAGKSHNFFESPICGGKERLNHPTQKPIALMEWLLDLLSNAGGRVLDPCAGVGSTGATGLAREYWLIEKEEEYYNQMRSRLSATT